MSVESVMDLKKVAKQGQRELLHSKRMQVLLEIRTIMTVALNDLDVDNPADPRWEVVKRLRKLSKWLLIPPSNKLKRIQKTLRLLEEIW